MTEDKNSKQEEKKKIVAKPLPVDKEKAREIESNMTNQVKKEEFPKENVKEKDEKSKPKPKETPKVKKEEAIAKGNSLPVSKKHAMYICSFIKNKEIDKAISDLERVIKFKQAVPFKGEIPHRKGNMMSGRYPIKTSKYFINLLKALKGNATVNGLELEKIVISEASASWAARPQIRGGARAKRTNIILKAKEKLEAKK